MKTILFAIVTIALAGCVTCSHDDARKDDLKATSIGTVTIAGEEKIRSYCEEEWSGDWAMIANCVERQTQGFLALQRLVEEHNIQDGDTTPAAMIFEKCSREWQYGYGLPDLRMVANCFERQWAGYKKLNP